MIGAAVRGTVVGVDGRFLANRGFLDGRGGYGVIRSAVVDAAVLPCG